MGDDVNKDETEAWSSRWDVDCDRREFGRPLGPAGRLGTVMAQWSKVPRQASQTPHGIFLTQQFIRSRFTVAVPTMNSSV